MVKRVAGLARRGAGAYYRTVRDASPNARRYLLLGVLTNVGVGILSTVFALYISSVGMSARVVGDVEAALGLASAAVCIIIPPLVAVLGYRRLLATAVIAYAVARVGQISVGGAGAIVALGLLYGIGDGIIRTAGVAFLSESGVEGDDRTMLFTVDFALRVGSSFVGSLLGGLLPTALGLAMDETVALRWTISLAAVLFAAAVLPIAGAREPAVRSVHAWSGYVAAVRRFRSWDRLGRLVAPQVFISFGAGLVMPFVPLLLRTHLGAGVAQIGFIQGASAVMMALATLATPLLARKIGLVGTIVATELASLPMLFVIGTSGSLTLVAAAMWLRAGLMNMSWPIYNQLSVEGVPANDKPLVAGWSAVAWSAAWFAGSAAGGRLAESSYTTGYFVTAALYATGAVMSWLLLRRVSVAAVTPADSLPAERAEPQA